MFALLIVLFSLSACNSQGVVVFSPTEAPPGSVTVHFEHPSAVFGLEVPDNWSIFVNETDTLATAFFTPPGDAAPALEVGAVTLEDTLASQPLSSIISSYVDELRSRGRYISEQDRQQMGDGSWRITAIRANVAGSPEAINTFVIQNNSTLLIANAKVSENSNTRTGLELAINSLTLSSTPILSPAPLETLTSLNTGPIVVTNAFSWSTADGVYFITGEVTNIGSETVNSVPVHVSLLTENGTTTAEAPDVTMGLVLEPGRFVPFSLRFGQGLPEGSTSFTVNVGDDAWRNAMTPTSETASDALTWDSTSSVTTEGYLEVTGTVTNMSNDNVQNIVAIITVFDADENVIAASFVDAVPPSLAPGAEASFFFRVSEMGNTPENFIVDVQGLSS